MRRKLLAGAVLVLAAVAFTVWYVTPWPSVWVIRWVFDSGAATASEKLASHVPADVRSRADIGYDPADPDARLDIHYPARPQTGAPTIVWIHGGGFVSGRKEDLTHYLKVLAGRGYAVVNVDYTIAPEATYPTPARQFARALRYIDVNAGALGLERRYVLAGDSAGSQLAAQLANIVTSADYASAVGIAAPVEPSSLAGALLYCGVYDVTTMNTDSGGVLGWFMRTVTWSYSGRRDWRDAEGFETFSVAQYVTPAFPPAFVSAGNKDPLLPQSRQMAAALKAAGVPVDELFYAPDYAEDLPHEYQFDLDTSAGKLALERSLAWLSGLSRQSGSEPSAASARSAGLRAAAP